MAKGTDMIIDISDNQFKKLCENTELHLPLRWDGKDYVDSLNKLYSLYIDTLQDTSNKKRSYNSYIDVDMDVIERICQGIQKSVEQYLNGFPSSAFKEMDKIMKNMMETPLKIYKKSCFGDFENDSLDLYRVVSVNENIQYERSRVFHVPYYMRSKVSTSRYSIAGFPSLYLGTSLELCCEEINLKEDKSFTIASRFKFQRNRCISDVEIKVIELAVKPQDFIELELYSNEYKGRRIDRNLLNKKEVKKAYCLWYPLIAACSFIRANKSDPFAPEYIIPQLLMQWIRYKIRDSYNNLMGIRYFSCASMKSSDLGFNYVFPTSGKPGRKYPYCPILMESFKMTRPQYIHEFAGIKSCEWFLSQDDDLKFIDGSTYSFLDEDI